MWVHVGDTSWLLDLHGDVSMVTKLGNALRLEVVPPEGAGVVEVLLRHGGGEREMEVEWKGEGVAELSGGVQLKENRGKPTKVRSSSLVPRPSPTPFLMRFRGQESGVGDSLGTGRV